MRMSVTTMLYLALVLVINLISCDRRESGSSAAKTQEKQLSTTSNGTPLVRAALSGQIEKVRQLLLQGTDVNLARHDGATALHGAAMSGHKEIADLLVSSGARLNAKESLNGYTPLHWAVFKCDAEIVNLLLQRGADPMVTDANGRTPLDLARAMQASTRLESYSVVVLALQSVTKSAGQNPRNATEVLVDALDAEPGPEVGSVARQLVSEGVLAVPALIKVVKDGSTSQRKRENAMFVLGKIGAVSDDVGDTFAWVLSQSAFADRKGDYLGYVGQNRITSPKIAAVLTTSITDSRVEVRANALSAAIATGLTDSLRQLDLRNLLRDSDHRVRINAALAIGYLRAAEIATVEALRRLASNDEVPSVRIAATQALERLAQQ